MKDDIEKELLKGQDALLQGKGHTGLFKYLNKNFPGLSNAYIINWIPEQGEDIFYVLVDGTLIEVEISRTERHNACVHKELEITNYKRKLGKVNRRKLVAAISLAKLDANK